MPANAPPNTSAYVKRLTEWSEAAVAQRLKHNGHHVLRIADIGTGATMIERPNGGKIVMPDLQVFAQEHAPTLIEVKAKTNGAYKYQIGQQWCTGFDLDKYEAYLEINKMTRVGISLIHLKHRKPDTSWCPYVLFEWIDNLPKPMTFSDPNNPRNALAVWDVSKSSDPSRLGPFLYRGHVEVPADILALAAEVKAVVHPWDRPLWRDPMQLELGHGVWQQSGDAAAPIIERVLRSRFA